MVNIVLSPDGKLIAVSNGHNENVRPEKEESSCWMYSRTSGEFFSCACLAGSAEKPANKTEAKPAAKRAAEPLREIFSYVRGHEHNWVPGGVDLPFCQRCTGLYVGAAPPCSISVVRAKAHERRPRLHGICLLLMIPFGYDLVAQTGEERTLNR